MIKIKTLMIIVLLLVAVLPLKGGETVRLKYNRIYEISDEPLARIGGLAEDGKI